MLYARARALPIALSLTLTCACTETPAPFDGGDANARDASVDVDGGRLSPDAGAGDAGALDAGHAVDGGVVVSDGGPHDAGASDAGASDAGTLDAGASDAGPTDAGGEDAGTGASDAGPIDPIAACFADIIDENAPSGPNYAQFSPTIGAHCQGTAHQQIAGIERVVFLGDSVTVGTPPTTSGNFYRNILADQLATRFSLTAPTFTWRTANPLTGQSGTRDSGDFSSCAKWGARTDDLMYDNSQVEDCFPLEERHKKTLVIMTIGGNDIASLAKQEPDGVPFEQILLNTETFIAHLDAAVAWLKDPVNVPGGVDVVFANMFEFTDATGEIGSCPASGLAGFDEPWEDPAALESIVVHANTQFMRIAALHGADMIFMLEAFCGHGFNRDLEEGRCYRGPDAELWFDLSCIHPNPTGHAEIASMFMAVIEGS
jgi:lysophospholipase L1-like esterase